MGILDQYGITKEKIAQFSAPKQEPDTLAHLEPYINEASAATGLDKNLLRGVILRESGGRVDARPLDPVTGLAVSTAYGPMQLLDSTAEEMGVDATDPRQNILGGAKYLKQQLDTFGDVNTALTAYFKGPAKAKQYGTNVPGTEGGTTAPKYIQDILAHKAKYDARDLSATRRFLATPTAAAIAKKYAQNAAPAETPTAPPTPAPEPQTWRAPMLLEGQSPTAPQTAAPEPEVKTGLLTPVKGLVSGLTSLAGDAMQGIASYLAVAHPELKSKEYEAMTRQTAQKIRDLTPEKWNKEVEVATNGDLWNPGKPGEMANTWLTFTAQNAPQYLTNLATPVGSAAILIAREAGSFDESAARIGIPLDVREKYTAAYSVPAGMSEYVDNLMMLGLNKIPPAKALADKMKGGIVKGLSKKFGPVAARALEKTGEFVGIGLVEGGQEISQNAYQSYMLGLAAKEAGMDPEKLRAEGKLPPLVDWKSFALGAGIGIITKGAIDIGGKAASRVLQPVKKEPDTKFVMVGPQGEALPSEGEIEAVRRKIASAPTPEAPVPNFVKEREAADIAQSRQNVPMVVAGRQLATIPEPPQTAPETAPTPEPAEKVVPVSGNPVLFNELAKKIGITKNSQLDYLGQLAEQGTPEAKKQIATILNPLNDKEAEQFSELFGKGMRVTVLTPEQTTSITDFFAKKPEAPATAAPEAKPTIVEPTGTANVRRGKRIASEVPGLTFKYESPRISNQPRQYGFDLKLPDGETTELVAGTTQEARQKVQERLAQYKAAQKPLPLTGDRRTETKPVLGDKRQGDRRKDSEKRKLVAEMTPEEQTAALLTDEDTGLGSKRAWEERRKTYYNAEDQGAPPPHKKQAMIDVDGLKFINDNVSYEAGTTLIKEVAKALNDAGISADRTGGDEIKAVGNEDLDQKIESAREALSKKTIRVTLDNGEVAEFKGGFSYGTATNEVGFDRAESEAEKRLHAEKSVREKSGQRAARGEQPPGFSRRTPSEGTQGDEGGSGVETPPTVEPTTAAPSIGTHDETDADVNFLVDRGIPHNAAVKVAEKVKEVIASGKYHSVLDPVNKNARELYAHLTGKKLPKGILATRVAVEEMRKPAGTTLPPSATKPRFTFAKDFKPSFKNKKNGESVEFKKPKMFEVPELPGVKFVSHEHTDPAAKGWYAVSDAATGAQLFEGGTRNLAVSHLLNYVETHAITLEKYAKLTGDLVAKDPSIVRPGVTDAETTPSAEDFARKWWESRTVAERIPLLISKGWNKGNRQRIANQSWEELSPATKNVLERDYEAPAASEKVMTFKEMNQAYINGLEVRWAKSSGVPDRGPMKILHMNSEGSIRVDPTGNAHYNASNFVLAEKQPSTKKEVIPNESKEVQTETSVVPGTKDLIDGIASKLRAGVKFDNNLLTKMAVEAFGGTRGEGKYDPRDAYDAAEAAMNRVIREDGIVDFKDPEGTLKALLELTALMPTQTDRTHEQVEFQQFSTPPGEAFVAASVSGIRDGMTAIEPSAGTGNIATFMELMGAEVTANEITPRRKGILELLGFKTTSVDGEQLNNLLPDDIVPDVVVMNPPFSATGGRVAAHKTEYGARHVEQALARLRDGGRLVAIVGEGMAHDRAKFQEWWSKIEGKYNVRANLGMDGKHYGKYGTTFGNNILVIDKTGPTPGENRAERVKNIVRGENLSPIQAMDLLKDIAKEDVYGRINRGSSENASGKVPTKGKGKVSPRGSDEGTAGGRKRGPASSPDIGAGAGPVGDMASTGGQGPGVGGETGRESGRAGGRGAIVEGSATTEAGTGERAGGEPGGTTAGSMKDAAKAEFEKMMAGEQPVTTSEGSITRRSNEIEAEKVARDAAMAKVKERIAALGKSLTQRDMNKLYSFGTEQMEIGFEIVSGLVEAGYHEFKAMAMQIQEMAGDYMKSDDFKKIIQTAYDAYAKVNKAVTPRTQTIDEVMAGEATLTSDKSETMKEEEGGVFAQYRVQKATYKGAKKHPAAIVESASLASVEPPDVTYKISIPQNVIDDGKLSDVQLEAITYAGQRHEQLLPNGARAEFLIGDGTGVGKGREIAGIILDNHGKGRKKHIWISVNEDLFSDAQRDLYSEKERKYATGFDPERELNGVGVPLKLINAKSYKVDEAIEDKEGIVFVPYSTISNDFTGKKRRFTQIANWLGSDFDGVIAFDEAHLMKNAVGTDMGGRATAEEGSQRGAMGTQLKKMFPNARVVNVSATAATTYTNLGYLTRIGLWGPGAPFNSFEAFMGAMSRGGVGAMEMLSRDLKAMGAYVSRMISYKGPTKELTVAYEPLVHNLTQDEKDSYASIADLWSTLLQEFDAAAKNANMGKKKGRNFNAFYSAQQRFFLQYMMSIQLNDMLEAASKDLEAGKSVVISLYNTNETSTANKVAQAQADGIDIEDIDFTPKEMLVELVEKYFPIQEYQEVQNETGTGVVRVPMTHPDGTPVINRENKATQDRLLDTIGNLRMPANPMDAMVNYFGSNKVAEITGRSKRIEGGKYDPRTKSLIGGKYVTKTIKGVNKDNQRRAEIQAFQSGKKRVAVISGAASTGISLHADERAKNQQRRVFYAMQLSWSADTQMQSFGRVHRAFQASAPIIKLVQVDVAGQKRLVNTVSSRLASLGAVATGTREAYSGGVFAVEDVTDDYGKSALEWLYSRKNEFFPLLKQMGVINEDGNVKESASKNVDQFLNRIMALPVDDQNMLYERFHEKYQEIVAREKENGTFDSGVETLKAKNVRLGKAPEVIYTDPSGAKTELVQLDGDFKTNRVTFEEMQSTLKDAKYMRNRKSGKLWAVADSMIPGKVRFMGPSGSRRTESTYDVTDEHYEEIDEGVAQKEWAADYAKVPEYETEKVYLITGAVFPIYDKLFKTGMRAKVIRANSEDKAYVGVRIDAKDVVGVRTRLGIGSALANATPQEIYDLIHGNDSIIELDNGWVVKMTKVHGEDRMEIDWKATSRPNLEELIGYGAFDETIDWAKRYFIPIDETDGPATMGKILKRHKAIRDLTTLIDEDTDPQGLSAKKWDMPLEAEKKTDEKVNLTEIVRFVEKAFGVAVRGKATYRWKNAGMYYPKKWIVRMKKWGELPVLTHEVAHHIDTLLKKSVGPQWKTKGGAVANKELEALDYEPEKKRISEGFAEWMRMYLTAETDNAPHFSEYFHNLLRGEPKLKESIGQLAEMMKTWRNMGAVGRVMAQIDMKGEHTKIPLGKKIFNARNWFVEKWINSIDSMLRVNKALGIKSRKNIRPTQDPVEMATMQMRKAAGIARTFVKVAAVNMEGQRVGPSLVAILKPIDPTAMNEFIAYAVAKRALDYEEQGLESGFDIDDVNIVLDTFKDPIWDKAVDELTAWNGHILDWLVKAGNLSPKEAELMHKLNPHYVPFKRVFIEEVLAVKIRQGSGSAANPPKGIHQRTGSGRPLINPIESMVQQLTATIQIAHKAQAVRLLADYQDRDGAGKFITLIDPPMEATQVSIGDTVSGLKKLRADIAGEKDSGDSNAKVIETIDDIIESLKQLGFDMKDADINKLMTMFTQAAQFNGKDNIISIWRNGKREFYEVDIEVYRAIMSMDMPQREAIVKILGPFARMVRLGATGLNLPFALAKNWQRDLQSYLILSKHAMANPVGFFKGLAKSINPEEGSLFWRYKAMGGTLSGMMGYDRATTMKAYDEILAENLKGTKKALYVAQHPLVLIDYLRDFLGFFEQAARSAELHQSYEKYRSEKKDWTEMDCFVAAFNDAQDVTVNFTRGGTSAKAMNEVSAFFNVAIQGPDKFYRALRDNPGQTVAKGLVWLTIPAILSWLNNRDKEWYKNLPLEYRYSNYFFELPGGSVLRIPIPFEIGVVFASIPWAALDHDKSGGEAIGKMLLNMLPSFVPSAAKPILDVGMNQDYLGRPIESQDMQRMPIGDRRHSYTSQIAVAASKALNTFGVKLSPVQVDYALVGYTGGMSRQLPTRAIKTVEDVPVLNSLLLRMPDEPKKQTNEFFEEYGRLGELNHVNELKGKDYFRYQQLNDFYNDTWKNIAPVLKLAKEKNKPEVLKNAYKYLGKELARLGY